MKVKKPLKKNSVCQRSNLTPPHATRRIAGQLFTQYFLSEGIRTTSEWEVRWTPIVGQDRGGIKRESRC